MRILFLLNVLAWCEHVGIHHIFDKTAVCAQQSYRISAILAGERERVHDVERVATRADADHSIAGFDHICQLFREDMFIGRIVAPGGDKGNVIGEGDSFEARHTGHDRVFGEIKGEVRGRCSAPAIAHDEDTMPVGVNFL